MAHIWKTILLITDKFNWLCKITLLANTTNKTTDFVFQYITYINKITTFQPLCRDLQCWYLYWLIVQVVTRECISIGSCHIIENRKQVKAERIYWSDTLISSCREVCMHDVSTRGLECYTWPWIFSSSLYSILRGIQNSYTMFDFVTHLPLYIYRLPLCSSQNGTFAQISQLKLTIYL